MAERHDDLSGWAAFVTELQEQDAATVARKRMQRWEGVAAIVTPSGDSFKMIDGVLEHCSARYEWRVLEESDYGVKWRVHYTARGANAADIDSRIRDVSSAVGVEITRPDGTHWAWVNTDRVVLLEP